MNERKDVGQEKQKSFVAPIVNKPFDEFVEERDSTEEVEDEKLSEAVKELGLDFSKVENPKADSFLLDSDEVSLVVYAKRLLAQITILRKSKQWQNITPTQRAFLVGAHTVLFQVLGETPRKEDKFYGTIKELVGDSYPQQLLGVFGDTNRLAKLGKVNRQKLYELLTTIEG